MSDLKPMLKMKVEQHNIQMQQGFAQRMDGAFSNMQRCVEQYGVKHNNILSGYSQAVGTNKTILP